MRRGDRENSKKLLQYHCGNIQLENYRLSWNVHKHNVTVSFNKNLVFFLVFLFFDWFKMFQYRFKGIQVGVIMFNFKPVLENQ